MHRDWSVEERSNDHTDRLDAAWVDIQRSLTAFLSRRLGSKEDACDAVQDIYVQLRDTEAAPIRDLASYAFSIAKNHVRKHYRSRFQHLRLEESLLDDQPALQTFEEPSSPEHQCSLEEELDAVMREFDRLPAATKRSFAAYVQGEPFPSVATRLGMDTRTVYRHIARLRAHFQQVRQRLRRVR